MTTTCKQAAIVLFIVCATSNNVSATFFPAVEMPTQKEREEQRVKEYLTWDYLWGETNRAFREVVGGGAVNLDYTYGTQDLVGNVPFEVPIPFESETELNTYSIRPEIVWTNWLSTYALAAFHQGTSTSQFTSLDLDGWGAGVGVYGALGLPAYYPAFDENLTIDPLFVIPDFNWTHNEFDDVENAVNIYNLTIRAGGALRTKRLYWGFYGGPRYQATTEDLTIRFNSMPVLIEAQPKNAWNGVIGWFFGVMFTKCERRPDLLLTVEGNVGNRQGVTVSLRYEHDFLQYFTSGWLSTIARADADCRRPD